MNTRQFRYREPGTHDISPPRDAAAIVRLENGHPYDLRARSDLTIVFITIPALSHDIIYSDVNSFE